jgi:transcriptional regulator with XRE-family HTH domain
MEMSPPTTAEQLKGETVAQMEAIKLALRREIRHRGLKQRDLARQLGYSDSYLANLLGNIKGRQPAGLRVDTLLALLSQLEIEPLEFLASVLELPAASHAAAYPRSRASILELVGLFQQAQGVPEQKVERLAGSTLKLMREIVGLLSESDG